MSIYGVNYSTDSRDNRVTYWQRFSNKTAALKWREALGPGGTGPSFSPENGHLYIRKVYELHGRLPTGSRLIALMDRGGCSSTVARANWIMSEGTIVE